MSESFDQMASYRQIADLHKRVTDLESQLDALRPKPQASIVEVPGTVTARYCDGKITGWVFSPLGSCAGHFGPTAVVVDGPGIDNIDDVDGPFWKAVQDDLALNGFNVDWEE